MSRSARVTAAHQRAVARLAGECLDLGEDAAAWQGHLLGGLLGLSGAGLGFVNAVPAGGGPADPPALARFFATPGLAEAGGRWRAEADRDRWHEWVARPAGRAAFRFTDHAPMARFFATPGPILTRTRQELVTDREWSRSAFANDSLRPFGMYEGLLSRAPGGPAGAPGVVFALTHSPGGRPFRVRAARVVDHLQRALAPHYGRGLWLGCQPNLHGLSPRLRQVLDCLLDGESEKHAALRLGIHSTTVHDHVKRLYRHFGVGARAELLAYFLRRHRRPDPPAGPSPGPGRRVR